jgi:hypothetical protein
MKAPTDPAAPHGRDPNGVPLAPYGHRTDGIPRRSNQGARSGNGFSPVGKVSPPPRKPDASPPGSPVVLSRADRARRDALVALTEMGIVLPLVSASVSPPIAKRIGELQSMALAGDAVIVAQFAPSAAEALVVLAQSKPGVLRWLDTMEERAPYLMLAQVGAQVVKALIGNHTHPSRRLADAGMRLAEMRAQQMVRAIEEEAAAMGIPTSVSMPGDPDQIDTESDEI